VRLKLGPAQVITTQAEACATETGRICFRFTGYGARGKKKESFDTMTTPLSGIIPALATPFDDRGALAVDRIRGKYWAVQQSGPFRIPGERLDGRIGPARPGRNSKRSLAAVREAAGAGAHSDCRDGSGFDGGKQSRARKSPPSWAMTMPWFAPPYFFQADDENRISWSSTFAAWRTLRGISSSAVLGAAVHRSAD